GPGDRAISQALIIDDQEVSSDSRPVAGITPVDQLTNPTRFVVFSPDGKRFGYAKPVPGGTAAVIDGKVGRAYDGIQLIQFSPDSQHVVYVGNRTLNFPVIDGQEMKGATMIKGFVFSPIGGRYAYNANGSDGYHIVVDGKESPRYYSAIDNTITFSPDGKHYAYAAYSNLMTVDVVVDGTALQTGGIGQFSTRSTPRFNFPSIIYSPDSSRLAFAKQTRDTPLTWLINGEEFARGQTWEFPMFSPTSKHFAVM